MNWPKNIIFDMDGVLADSEVIHLKAESLACKRFGIEAPTSEWENFSGKTAESIFEYLNNKYAGGRAEVPEIVKFSTEKYLELAAEELMPIRGAVEFVKLSRTKFEKLGVVTSSNQRILKMFFDKFELYEFFDSVLTGDDVKKGKPDPEPYLMSAQALRVEPSECIVIEDADNGIVSAKRAGCIAIGLTTNYPKKKMLEFGADYAVDSFEELRSLLFG